MHLPLLRRLALVLVSASLLAACADTPDTRSALRKDSDYQTGSHLPRRDRGNVQTYQGDALQDLTRTPSPTRPPGS